MLCFILWSCSGIFGQIKQISEQEIENQTKFIEALSPSLIGEPEESIRQLEEFIKEDPTAAVAHYQLARLYEATDQFASAKAAIQKATRLKPEVEWYWIVQAEMMRNYNEWTLCAEAYQNLIELRPDKSNYSISLAHCYLQMGNTEDCLIVLNELENSIGLQKEISLKRFQVYQALGDRPSAEKELLQLADAEPENIDYLLKLARFYREEEQQDLEIATYRKILSIDSTNTQARIQLTELSTSDGSQLLNELSAIIKDPEASIDLKVRKLVPFLQAVNSDVPEETRQLIEILNQLVETHPRDAKSYTMLADGYFNTGQLRTSLLPYQKAEELEPGIASVWMQHMETLLYLDEYDRCIEIAEEALIYFPNQVEIYLMAAEAALKNEKSSQALSYLSACDFMLSEDEILRQQFTVLQLLSNNNAEGIEQWLEKQSKSNFTLPDAAVLLFELFAVDHQGFTDQIILQAQGPLKENYEAQLAAAYALAEISAWQSAKEYLDFCLRLGGGIIPDTFLLLMDVGSALQKDDYVKLAKMRLDRMGYTLKTAP